MIDNGVDSDMHLTRVVEWVLNTLGKAFALGIGLAFVFAFVGMAFEQTWVIALGGLFGPLGFAFMLIDARAPGPREPF